MTKPTIPPGTPPQAPADTTSAASTGVGPRVKPQARPDTGLKLVALDADDLQVVAAHLQDAVGRVRDMAFMPKERRFAFILNRFDWMKPRTATRQTFERRRCALRFEHVLGARITGIVQTDKRQVLSLLTMTFEQAREGDPGGHLTLLFAGGGAVRLEVECIEAELRDLGAGWRTSAKPDHPEG